MLEMMCRALWYQQFKGVAATQPDLGQFKIDLKLIFFSLPRIKVKCPHNGHGHLFLSVGNFMTYWYMTYNSK